MERTHFDDLLDDLRLQVELMGLRVDENLERMRMVLRTADAELAEDALRSDDAIDALHLGLTERCYSLCALKAPVAADLRLTMAVVRVSAELERVGDLSLRVVKIAWTDGALLRREPEVHAVLVEMADRAVAAFRHALTAWSRLDQDAAAAVVDATPMQGLSAELAACITRLRGDLAPQVAARAVRVGDALDRIADHARVIGARVRYLVSGDPLHLVAEVR